MLETIYTLYQSIMSKQPWALVLNVVLFFVIITFCYYFVAYLQEHKVFAKFVAKIKADVKEQERLREEEFRRQFEIEGEFRTKNRMQKLSKKLSNSGITIRHPEITAETYTIFVVGSCLLVGLVLQVVYNNIVTSLIGVVITYFTWALLLELMIASNYSKLEKETIKFINLLKNVSHTEGSVSEMLARTVPYLSGPLKLSIERCYYEIKTTGDTSLALQHLCERTNYAKLREIFEALRICSTHNEDYETVINESSDSVADYITYRKEMKQIKQSNLIDIFVMAGAGLLIINSLKGMLKDVDVAHVLFG